MIKALHWQSGNEHLETLGTGHIFPLQNFVFNPTYEVTPLLESGIPVFLSSEIQILKQIGQGCFGKVFRGELKSGEAVAVKIMKREHAGEALKEVETMSGFTHDNILKMIGIASNQGMILWLLTIYIVSVIDERGRKRNIEVKLGRALWLIFRRWFTLASFWVHGIWGFGDVTSYSHGGKWAEQGSIWSWNFSSGPHNGLLKLRFELSIQDPFRIVSNKVDKVLLSLNCNGETHPTAKDQNETQEGFCV